MSTIVLVVVTLVVLRTLLGLLACGRCGLLAQRCGLILWLLGSIVLLKVLNWLLVLDLLLLNKSNGLFFVWQTDLVTCLVMMILDSCRLVIPGECTVGMVTKG